MDFFLERFPSQSYEVSCKEPFCHRACRLAVVSVSVNEGEGHHSQLRHSRSQLRGSVYNLPATRSATRTPSARLARTVRVSDGDTRLWHCVRPQPTRIITRFGFSCPGHLPTPSQKHTSRTAHKSRCTSGLVFDTGRFLRKFHDFISTYSFKGEGNRVERRLDGDLRSPGCHFGVTWPPRTASTHGAGSARPGILRGLLCTGHASTCWPQRLGRVAVE